MDTIFALASARGKAGISVIRISGPRSFSCLEQLGGIAKPRQATLRRLTYRGEFLDEAVVVMYPAPNSFTGEDVAELQVHGSLATVSAVLHALGQMDGLRLAEPGEFTRRALENERLDLTQVEGLADLVEAETEAQRKQALRVLVGDLANLVGVWRAKMLRAVALIEATIDFVDEDTPTDVMPEVIGLLSAVSVEIQNQLNGSKAAEQVRDGFIVAIVGPPNSGKSTLLNRLAGRDAALTSDIAGTTRDVLEVRMDLRGLAVTLLDTAGIRETVDDIEALGIERAISRAKEADLRLILQEAGVDSGIEPGEGDIVLTSKSDIRDGDFSARTGECIDQLVDRIGTELSRRTASAGLVTRERHRSALRDASIKLVSVLDSMGDGDMLPEIMSEDIRSAVRSLDILIGHIGVEDVLGEIFSSFCIGK